jgi:hypothetical protein
MVNWDKWQWKTIRTNTNYWFIVVISKQRWFLTYYLIPFEKYFFVTFFFFFFVNTHFDNRMSKIGS